MKKKTAKRIKKNPPKAKNKNNGCLHEATVIFYILFYIAKEFY